MSERQGLESKWRTETRAPDTLFSAVSTVHPALVQVMFARGLRTPDTCADFLQGICRDNDDPLLLADMSRAVDRLVRARDAGEHVAVFTDYDADGVNAAAVLAAGLPLVGIQPRVRLPNRFVDGYGITADIVAELADAGAHVIVTADCGSTAHDAAAVARDRGVDLIITDHHQCPPRLPAAYALVNPWRTDCAYPCDYLCGAGVAFKLLQALGDRLHPAGRVAVEGLLDLVAVATVADIMPLLGENRRLVLRGLEIMNAFPRPGVRALIEIAGLRPGQVDAAALGYRIAPRVNAAGRLDDPSIAFRLLMTDSYEEAFDLAKQVNDLNLERQQLTRDFEQQAAALVEPILARGAFGLVCGGEAWPQGIVGLVAGKLAQTHHRPALVYTIRDKQATGSGRSIPGFDLLEALKACDDVFQRYGGHAAAAGFTIPAARLGELEQRFEAAVHASLAPHLMEPVLKLDGYLKPSTVSLEFAASLEKLAPFGAGFREPIFGLRQMRVLESRVVGAEGQHWKTRLRHETGGPVLDAIHFGGGHLAASAPVGTVLDAAATVRRSEFNGYWRTDLHLEDIALPP